MQSDKAFAARVEPFLSRAAAYAYSITRDRSDAEDAVQDSLIKAYEALRRYDEARSFKAWWFAIVRNCCLDLLRRQRARPEKTVADPARLAQTAWEPLRGLDERDALLAALERVSPDHRAILELRYFGDCTYAEMAAALDIPQGTVMSRLHAARHALAKAYRKDNL